MMLTYAEADWLAQLMEQNKCATHGMTAMVACEKCRRTVGCTLCIPDVRVCFCENDL